jgi:uncharacterized OsmC-like protein
MTSTITTRLNAVDIETVGGLIQTVDANPDKGKTTWSAEVAWQQGFQSEATIRQFEPIASDEPTALGGTDRAPNPVEQLLAALGNCLAVGYAANATAAGIAIHELTIAVSGELNLEVFLGLAEGHAGFDAITAEVRLITDGGDEEVRELHRKVVSTSPVGHTLGRAVPVDIELAPATR